MNPGGQSIGRVRPGKSHAAGFPLLPPLGQRSPPRRRILFVLAAAAVLLLRLLGLRLGRLLLLLFLLLRSPAAAKGHGVDEARARSGQVPRPALSPACQTLSIPFLHPPSRASPVPRLLRSFPLALSGLLPLPHLGRHRRMQLLALPREAAVGGCREQQVAYLAPGLSRGLSRAGWQPPAQQQPGVPASRAAPHLRLAQRLGLGGGLRLQHHALLQAGGGQRRVGPPLRRLQVVLQYCLLFGEQAGA